MEQRAQALHRQIANWRERLEQGVDVDTATLLLDSIEEAERALGITAHSMSEGSGVERYEVAQAHAMSGS
jgi:hypothetical protein